MTPIVGDLISVSCRVNGTHHDLRVQGVAATSNPAESWLAATASCGLEYPAIATRPDPRHGAVVVHETNWALRVLATVHYALLAKRAEEYRIECIKAEALAARIRRDRYEEEEAA